MNQKELSKALAGKLKRGMPKIKILVNGDWGIGKTYVVRELANTALRESNFIYLSLFGQHSVDEIRQNLKREYLLHKTNTDETFLSKGLKTLSENKAMRSVMSHVSEKYIGLSLDPMELIPLALDDTFIVCFDDLERKSPQLPIEDVLGVIEQIGQQCKVVIIANEKQIDSELDKYNSFKEKVVDRTYTLEEMDAETVKTFIRMQMPEFKNDDALAGLENNIFEFFQFHNIKNLRTLQKSVSFALELRSQVEPDRTLIDLCCAIVSENAIGVNVDNISQNEDRTFYKKYGFRQTLELVVQALVRFYKTSQLDRDKINEYLNPPQTECSKILEDLQESWFKNESVLNAHYQRVRDALLTDDYGFFESCEKLIYILAYLQTCKTLYNLQYDVDLLMDKATLAIARLVDINSTGAMLDIIMIRKMFTNVGFLDQLLESYEVEFKNRSGETGIQRYYEAYKLGNYHSCVEIVKKYPMIIPSILDTFDVIAEPIYTHELYLLMTTIVSFSRLDKTPQTMVLNKLHRLLAQATDSVVRHRIEAVIRHPF